MLSGAAASSGPSAEIQSMSAADQQEDVLTRHRTRDDDILTSQESLQQRKHRATVVLL